ncbi:hypothetical protein M0802_014279 [Mischocyttarus mexicanus]|nr:hypothetical protein M0802_014279 [Mischocyttarus mexicanus]
MSIREVEVHFTTKLSQGQCPTLTTEMLYCWGMCYGETKREKER